MYWIKQVKKCRSKSCTCASFYGRLMKYHSSFKFLNKLFDNTCSNKYYFYTKVFDFMALAFGLPSSWPRSRKSSYRGEFATEPFSEDKVLLLSYTPPIFQGLPADHIYHSTFVLQMYIQNSDFTLQIKSEIQLLLHVQGSIVFNRGKRTQA